MIKLLGLLGFSDCLYLNIIHHSHCSFNFHLLHPCFIQCLVLHSRLDLLPHLIHYEQVLHFFLNLTTTHLLLFSMFLLLYLQFPSFSPFLPIFITLSLWVHRWTQMIFFLFFPSFSLHRICTCSFRHFLPLH